MATADTKLPLDRALTFGQAVMAATGEPLRAAAEIRTVQVNIGLRCNLACRHCHVESSPKRSEEMDWPTMQQVIAVAESLGAETVDITGGAPEMHPHFREFVELALSKSLQVIVRTNLTIMLAEEHADLPEWFALRKVNLVASLPCYLPTNVDKQRGRNVYAESIEVIKRLNAVGYGIDPEKQLDLVYNPLGTNLPPDQVGLEEAYRRELKREFDISFSSLFTITNMPIGRFLTDLEHSGESEGYSEVLRNAFNPATVDGLMCRHQLHVGWDGKLYDCDFNFAIGLPAAANARHISELKSETVRSRKVVVGEHCFACTAGSGSSCGGSLVSLDM